MDIGTYAGIVWRALDEERQGMSLSALTARVNLSPFEVAAGIGWLARENKIWIAGNGEEDMHLSVSQERYY